MKKNNLIQSQIIFEFTKKGFRFIAKNIPPYIWLVTGVLFLIGWYLYLFAK